MRKALHNFIRPLALLTCLALAGCTAAGEVTPELPLSNHVPPALAEGVEREGSFEARLYFLSEDGLRLVPETREISYTGNISHAQAVVEALAQGPSGDVLRPSLPDNVSLERVEISSDACNVYLSASYQPDARDWLKARAAVAATVYAAEGIGSINLYLEGVEPGYRGKPLGALAPLREQLDTYVASIEQEYNAWYEQAQSDTEAGSYETRTATLYFTDLQGKLLIARNSTVNYARSEDKAGIAALLVGKLLDGDASLEPVMPADLTWAEAPTDTPLSVLEASLLPTNEDGDLPHPIFPGPAPQENERSVITLRFQEPTYSFDEATLAGALTLTITGYIPNVAGVSIYLRQEDGSYRNLAGEDLYFTREDFTDAIGTSIYLPFPDAEGSMLHRVPRAVSGKSAYDPMVRLQELFKGPADPGVQYPLFTAEDIGSVYVTGDIAVVDWKGGFSQKLEDLLQEESFVLPMERRERLFIYSVVNAVTEIPGIQRVWMLEAGKKLGTVGELYLGNALLRNPGIMIDE